MACRWLIPLLNHPCTSSASLVVHWYGLRSAFAFTNDVEMESQAAARVRGPKAGRLGGASRTRGAGAGRGVGGREGGRCAGAGGTGRGADGLARHVAACGFAPPMWRRLSSLGE